MKRFSLRARHRRDLPSPSIDSCSHRFLELATFFLVVKPLFVCFYYIVVPSLLGKTLTEAREARKRGRRGRALPYATELPMGATYYILERHPDLR